MQQHLQRLQIDRKADFPEGVRAMPRSSRVATGPRARLSFVEQMAWVRRLDIWKRLRSSASVSIYQYWYPYVFGRSIALRYQTREPFELTGGSDLSGRPVQNQHLTRHSESNSALRQLRLLELVVRPRSECCIVTNQTNGSKGNSGCQFCLRCS